MYKSILNILLLVTITGSVLFAQEPKKKTTRVAVEYIKDHERVEALNIILRVRDGRYVPLKNAQVEIYNRNDTTRVLLRKISTDEDGKVTYILEDNPDIHMDTLGIMKFEVEYYGDDENSGSNKSISVKRADLDITFIKIDSLRSIEALVSEEKEKEIVPVKDLRINFFVKGTFSLYPFGKGQTDEGGRINIDFPIEMPGDTAGILTIVARVEEDDIYGTIETRGDINWGIPVPLPEEIQRGLGDTDAPLWMVYTLIILFSAVWFHYVYVVYLIVKIKRAKGNLQV